MHTLFRPFDEAAGASAPPDVSFEQEASPDVFTVPIPGVDSEMLEPLTSRGMGDVRLMLFYAIFDYKFSETTGFQRIQPENETLFEVIKDRVGEIRISSLIHMLGESSSFKQSLKVFCQLIGIDLKIIQNYGRKSMRLRYERERGVFYYGRPGVEGLSADFLLGRLSVLSNRSAQFTLLLELQKVDVSDERKQIASKYLVEGLKYLDCRYQQHFFDSLQKEIPAEIAEDTHVFQCLKNSCVIGRRHVRRWEAFYLNDDASPKEDGARDLHPVTVPRLVRRGESEWWCRTYQEMDALIRDRMKQFEKSQKPEERAVFEWRQARLASLKAEEEASRWKTPEQREAETQARILEQRRRWAEIRDRFYTPQEKLFIKAASRRGGLRCDDGLAAQKRREAEILAHQRFFCMRVSELHHRPMASERPSTHSP